MSNSIQNTKTSFLEENKKGLVVLLILFLLSSVGMFGQTTTIDQDIKITEKDTTTTSIVSLDSDIDFMNWFMGSKQSQSASDLHFNKNNSSLNTKKLIISTGGTPNRVLYRTFMKKVISKDNAIV